MKASQSPRASAAEGDPNTAGNRSGATFMTPPTTANPSASLEFIPHGMLDPCHSTAVSPNHLPRNRFCRERAARVQFHPAFRMTQNPPSMQPASAVGLPAAQTGKSPLGGARFVVPGTAHRTPAPVHSPLAIPSLARRISKRETWKVPLLSKPVTTKRDPPV